MLRLVFQDASRFVPFFHRCKDSQATLRTILEDIGFEILDCSRREKSFVYQNMEILKRTEYSRIIETYFLSLIKSKNAWIAEIKSNGDGNIGWKEVTRCKSGLIIVAGHVIAVNPFISRIPDHLKEEFEDVVLREITSQKILISNTNDGQQGYSILDKYHILVAYVKKPSGTCWEKFVLKILVDELVAGVVVNKRK